MPKLNVDLSYFEHRKTRRLIAALGKDSDVLPLRMWAYCGRVHPEDGTLTGYSAEEVESVCGWRGSPGKLVDAMVRIGFLDPVDDGYQIHEWLEHEGHIAAFSKRARKGAAVRWAKARGADASDDIEQCLKHTLSNAPPTHTNHTIPPTPKEEEARREADAQGKARCWISAECPTFLRSGITAFTRLILRLGYEEAIREVQEARADPNVGNPFAYIEAKLDNQHARNGRGRQSRVTQEDN